MASASHNHHPQIREHGLADGCSACGEIADDPFLLMDTENLSDLVRMVKDHPWSYPPGISDTHKRAYEAMALHLKRQNRIDTALEEHPLPIPVASWEDIDDDDDPMEPRFEMAD